MELQKLSPKENDSNVENPIRKGILQEPEEQFSYVGRSSMLYYASGVLQLGKGVNVLKEVLESKSR